MRTVSVTALRRIAIGAQRYAPRGRSGTRREVEEAIRTLGCVQLDSITAVERSHRIALGARVGDYPRETVSRLLGQGRIFEYWAHEACLLPIESWPLFHAARENGGRGWYGAVGKTHPHLADEILAGHDDGSGRDWNAVQRLYFDGDLHASLLTAGQVMGRIHAPIPVAQLLREMWDDCRARLAEMGARASRAPATAR